MKIDILVSTMNQSTNKLEKNMNLNDNDFIIVNQSENNIVESSNWVNSTTLGLSKSRNIALRESKADICVIADDDLVYVNNVSKIVNEAYLLYPDADLIIFQVHGIEKEFKTYSNKPKKVGYFSSMKSASVEITFKRESIEKNGIKFNELFGSGSTYMMGEDNIFLFDCLKRKLKIYYVPHKIADLHMTDSSWFKGYSPKYFYDLGTVYAEMSNKLSFLLITQFAIRKYGLYKKEISFRESIYQMFEGRNEYLNSKKIFNSK